MSVFDYWKDVYRDLSKKCAWLITLVVISMTFFQIFITFGLCDKH